MNKELEKRREDAEKQFNVLQEEKKTHQDKILEIETELARLQGEWRLINDLTAKNVSKDANKLEIVEGETDGKATKNT